ncbi:MAG: menaquinone biosynthesis family protein [Phycisphaerales bacterium]
MSATTLTLAHSPDADDAFMWWPITGKIDAGTGERIAAPVLDTGGLRFEAVAADIQALNERAMSRGDLDITAISMHALSHVSDRYALTRCGASMGEGYGPKVVARAGAGPAEMIRAVRSGGARVAAPGRQTTALLVFSLMIGAAPPRVNAMSFERVIESVVSGESDVGLVIHDGQLTFADAGLTEVADLGAWWGSHTSGLPLPLGANAVRRDLDERCGDGATEEVAGLLERSIAYSMENWEESIEYAATFAPGGATREKIERFVRMYVNELTRDMGERGVEAVRRLLGEGAAAGLCPRAALQVVGASGG